MIKPNIPDTNPSLPPGKTNVEGRGGDHPCIDVERVGDPETDEVECTPLATSGLDNLQIMVGEEKLLIRETRVGIDFLHRNIISILHCDK